MRKALKLEIAVDDFIPENRSLLHRVDIHLEITVLFDSNGPGIG